MVDPPSGKVKTVKSTQSAVQRNEGFSAATRLCFHGIISSPCYQSSCACGCSPRTRLATADRRACSKRRAHRYAPSLHPMLKRPPLKVVRDRGGYPPTESQWIRRVWGPGPADEPTLARQIILSARRGRPNSVLQLPTRPVPANSGRIPICHGRTPDRTAVRAK
jgi:hypothetical protein